MSVDDERRKNLWVAFSDLWLDNEVGQTGAEYVARVMLESGRPLDELRSILRHQVAPVVYGNLYNVFPGGEWAGFDREWLEREIKKNIARQEASGLYRWWVRSPLGQKLMTGMIEEDWARIEALYRERARNAHDAERLAGEPD